MGFITSTPPNAFRNFFPNETDKMNFTSKTGLLHESRKLRATALVYGSSIATSAPSTAYAVPLPRVARGRLGLWHLSFPRHNGGAVNVIQSHVANARVLGSFSHTTCFPISNPLWACFSDRSVSGERSEPIGALMPHVAFWVVQRLADCIQRQIVEFQCRTRLCGWCNSHGSCARRRREWFQCRTRLCGWCNIQSTSTHSTA